MQQNTNNHSYNNTNQAPNNFTRPATNYNNNNNNRTLNCTYCGRVGHEISICYKKFIDERKNNGTSNATQNSGNGQGPNATHGASGIHQIFSVNPNEIATTSYQN
jgi:hypothetical protein